MINDPLVEKYELTHITQFNTGAAPLSPEVIQKLAHKYPLAGIKQGWGMTESTSCITSTPPEYLDPQFAHTVGAAVANTILKVVDVESRVEVGFDIPGEVGCSYQLREYRALTSLQDPRQGTTGESWVPRQRNRNLRNVR